MYSSYFLDSLFYSKTQAKCLPQTTQYLVILHSTFKLISLKVKLPDDIIIEENFCCLNDSLLTVVLYSVLTDAATYLSGYCR